MAPIVACPTRTRISATAALAALALVATMSLTTTGAAADHVTCGQVITQNTTLHSDLDCSGDNPYPALTIGADGVKLDLGGHEISGHGIVVLNDGYDSVTIKDGDVFVAPGAAVVLQHANHNRLVDLRAGGAGGGIDLEDSDHNRVVRSLGEAEDVGVYMGDGSDSNVIDRSRASAYGPAVQISNSDENVIRRTSFVFSGAGDSLRVYDGSDGTIVRRNEFLGGGYGEITPGNGILVLSGTTNTLIVRNEVRNYAGSGIRVDSPSATLTRNSSNDNEEWGIFAVPGVTDGGHNTASGNGAGQCLNVAC